MTRAIAILAWLVRRLNRYVDAFGVPRGVLYTAVACRRRSVARVIQAPGAGPRVVARLGRHESDLDAFVYVFHERSYDFDYGTPTSIMDAGANVGYSALWFALEHPQARVIAVEPDLENFALLCDNVAGHPNIEPVHAALLDVDGQADVIDPGKGPWARRVQKTNDGWSGGNVLADVESVTVPTLMSKYALSTIDLLKLNIEGSELEVLSTSRDWMPVVRSIVVELHDRFRPGCMRAFMAATTDFAVEEFRGENVFVRRD